MDAVEYLKARARMCNEYTVSCTGCPLMKIDDNEYCGGHEHPEQAIEIVEKWAKEHPVKTYLSVLLEKFPETQLCNDDTPKFCPKDIFGNSKKYECCMPNMCSKCWNREYKEEE